MKKEAEFLKKIVYNSAKHIDLIDLELAELREKFYDDKTEIKTLLSQKIKIMNFMSGLITKNMYLFRPTDFKDIF